MKFIHGERTFLYEHEKNLLDRAIDQYNKVADEYYKTKNELKESPPDVRQKREKKLGAIKQKLETQRLCLDGMACLQAQLEAYRSSGKAATEGNRKEVTEKQKVLLAEGHHGADLALLAKFMQTDAKPRPGSKHTAHHIVPGKGKTSQAYLARTYIHRFGIRINDPDNGVWLPTYSKYTPLWSMPQSKGHLEYHTEGYERWVRNKLRVKSSEAFIRIELNLIGKLLQQNRLPEEARKKS